MVLYTQRVPTWTPNYNSVALAKIGRELDSGVLGPIGPMTSEECAAFETLNALVCVRENLEMADVDQHAMAKRGHGIQGVPSGEAEVDAQRCLELELDGAG